MSATLKATLNYASGTPVVVTNLYEVKVDNVGHSITLVVDSTAVNSVDGVPGTDPITVTLVYAAGATVVVTDVLDLKIDDVGLSISMVVDQTKVNNIDVVNV